MPDTMREDVLILSFFFFLSDQQSKTEGQAVCIYIEHRKAEILTNEELEQPMTAGIFTRKIADQLSK